MGRKESSRFAWLVLICLLAVSCAAPSSPGAGSSSSQPSTSGQTPSAPKQLTVGRQREPATIEGFTGEGGTAGGAGELRHFLHAHLTAQDPNDDFIPRLAAELPSLEQGTWR